MWTYEGDINRVYPKMVEDAMLYGDKVEQRGLTTRELSPVVFELENSRHRLVTSYGRPINVAFALAEVLWILAGRNDVDMLVHYNSRMADFTDDGETYNAAYGRRMRLSHGHDQIEDCIRILKEDPGSRQAVLNIWYPALDKGWANTMQGEFVMRDGTTKQGPIPRVTKDRACNLVSHMLLRHGRLDWTQMMRSNDAVWGTPYNVMQWTHVQEYIARRLGVDPGRYTHLSDSFHIYDPPLDGGKLPNVRPFDLYSEFPDVEHAPMSEVRDASRHEEDIRRGYDAAGYWSQFSRDLADIFQAHAHYRKHQDMDAYLKLVRCRDMVYSAAQVRFYMHQRWLAQPELRLHEYMFNDWPAKVVGWMRRST